ncbi:MAG: MFS transporter [Candidatus Woesebacteria bacterium]|nr:MAG: MFS transporter [Candidatus Woesebacteria bacterium]
MENKAFDRSKRFDLLRLNKFYLFWCRFFVDLNALNAVVQLFYLQRGVTLSQIYFLGIAFSVGVLIFDIPSSYLADRWGRKNTIFLGVLINILANGYLFVARGFWPFFIDTFILAASYSFFFGVEDAFLYDNSKEMKQEGIVIKTAGKYAAAGRISKILTPLFGAIIAKNLTSLQFDILLFINFVSSCFAAFFAFKLTEPKRFIAKFQTQLSIFKDGLSTFWNTEALRVFALNKSSIFIASFIFWRFYQDALYTRGFSVLLLGLIYPVSNAILVSVFVLAPKITEKINYSLIFNSVVYITLGASILFILTDFKLALYLSSIILLSVATVRDPFFFQQIHYRIKSYNRATSSSILGIFKNLSDIPLLLLSGYIASFGGKWIMVIPITLSLITIVFFRIKPKYIVLSYNED